MSVGLNILCGVPAAIALPRVGRYSRTLFTVLLSLGLSSPTIVTAFADPAILGRGLKNFVSNFLQDRYLGLGNPPQGAAIGILLLVIVSIGTAVILTLGRTRKRRSR